MMKKIYDAPKFEKVTCWGDAMILVGSIKSKTTHSINYVIPIRDQNTISGDIDGYDWSIYGDDGSYDDIEIVSD